MLKNILSLLLSKFYSKQESEAVGHQALPASSYTTLFTNKTITSWGAVASGVAANDGYLKLQSNGSGSTTAALMVMTPRLTSVIQYPFETAGISAWVPIAKGETWKVQGSDSTSINLYLYKTIGGGYQTLKKLLLQGGGLCLNSLSSSLRRSSLSVKRSGRQSNQRFLRAIQPCSLLLPTEKTITSQCPAQGTPTCAVMVFGLPILTGAPSLTSGLMRTGISASISTPKKVNSLDMLLGLVPNSLRLISIFTRPKAVSNLAVGGASC